LGAVGGMLGGLAGKVGDETISIERRLNALDEVEKIYSKYNKTSGWKVVK
jgi:hypothetical protein